MDAQQEYFAPLGRLVLPGGPKAVEQIARALRCHRQLLADAFSVRGWRVWHILGDRCEEHRLPSFARVSGGGILYPARAS